ncbi:MAG TPA: DUF1592 domain-containing protein [Bryobacteraceae bacterium]|jgi:hypothetical protein|nr:DUF1592 domain-containing protein [Bryobacteraceae bacterium]
MLRRYLFLFAAIFAAPGVYAANTPLEQQFAQTVRPFVQKYCFACHSGDSPAAQFDLASYTTLDSVIGDNSRWALAAGRLTAKEMPPSGMPQPPAELRQQVIDWIKAMRVEEARKNAGDPGLVLARRLSNAEYNYTIRDLTGVDLRPTREFPVDPANPEGFDNSGESLTMSPALLDKYLKAARSIADNLVLTPDGFDFASHPMLVETDRDRYCIQRIVDFYKRQPTDYAAYFEAAWSYKYRAQLAKPNATLASIAADAKVSPKYLAMVWALLEEPAGKASQEVGPIARLQSMWRALPAPNPDRLDPKSTPLREQCLEMRDFVVKIRRHTAMEFAAPLVNGLPPGSQPLLNWKLYEFADHRRDFEPKDLLDDTATPPEVPNIPHYPDLHEEAAPRWAALSANARSGDPDLVVPAAARGRYEASFTRFSSIFPDEFYVSERGRYFPDDSDDKGRYLSAGYHNTMGYFRDDTPLMELILDDKGRKELNRLWDEFDFVAAYTARTFVQYYYNQAGEVLGNGAESAQPRPEGHAVTDSAIIFRLRDQYVAKAAADPANDPIAPRAIREHFQRVNDTLRGLEKEHAAAEPLQLQALLQFAARAYRRPLSKAESDDILAYYHQLRQKEGLAHDDAMRDSIVSILMSPDFCYRFDLRGTTSGAGRISPLSGYELASRLSFFLWSSMPDRELLAHASAGDLQRPEVLLAQTHRMLKDDRVIGLATEFGGSWLDFRHFESIASVDRGRFPSFDNNLREAMFQEPIHLLADAIRNNRPALDLIYGDYTFVNASLAKHYGMPGLSSGEDDWVRVDHAGAYGRGGLLPMAVFLTENSPGLRTSPVKRGNWVVKKILGEVIPPPPPVVPELPADEAKSDLPIREKLLQHRANPMCAACHAKFDSFGLAFEGYGPIGDRRTRDLAGRLIDAMATFPGGGEGSGFQAIQDYIRQHRQKEYLENLSRKMLAYALDRSLQLSDDSLIESMQAKLAASGDRIGTLVDAIVTSPQFLNKRNTGARDTTAAVTKAATNGTKDR